MGLDSKNIENIDNQFKNIKKEFNNINTEYRRISTLHHDVWLESDYYFMTKYYLEGTSHEADLQHVERTYSSDSNDEGAKYTETRGIKPDYMLAQETAKEALNVLIFLNDEQKQPFANLLLRAQTAIQNNSNSESIKNDASKYGEIVTEIKEGYTEYSNYLYNKIEELAPDSVMYDKATNDTPRAVKIIAKEKNEKLEKLCDKYNNNQILIHTLSAEHKDSKNPNLDRLKAYSIKHYGPEGEAIKQDRNWGGWKYFDVAATLLTLVTLPFRLYKDGFNFFKAEGAKKLADAEGLLEQANIKPPEFKK